MNFKKWLLTELQYFNHILRIHVDFKIHYDQDMEFKAYDTKTNQILGWLIVGYGKREGLHTIYKVAVDPSFRRQGIATALYKAAEEKFGQLMPSSTQSDNAFDFWKTYRPEAVKDEIDLRPFKDQLIGKKFDHPTKGPIEIIRAHRSGATGVIKNRERYTELSLNKNDLIEFGLLP